MPWLSSSFPLMVLVYHDLSDTELITDRDPDHPKRMPPNNILYFLRWPNTVLAWAFADAIQHVHKDFNKQTCRQ